MHVQEKTKNKQTTRRAIFKSHSWKIILYPQLTLPSLHFYFFFFEISTGFTECPIKGLIVLTFHPHGSGLLGAQTHS